ncbi:DUF2871 domain-containing protein [Bacillus sp. 123MFChir2]|uniref:DUF2871 domain-containing protein n=1 Tax=Bacillus sp. 123MFChir2 TaxID=1169144 RepID=UPI000374D402|nr:DUF2871 domain-containing protein [Bacillus sp. 123MFChir2]
MKKLYNAAFTYLIIGLLSGVFAREYSKAQGIQGTTSLYKLHTHVLVLGFIFFLLAFTLSKLFAVHEAKSFNMWFIVYNVGLVLTIGSMATRGLLQLNGADFKGLSHIAGMSHTIIGIALVWFMILLKKSFKG